MSWMAKRVYLCSTAVTSLGMIGADCLFNTQKIETMNQFLNEGVLHFNHLKGVSNVGGTPFFISSTSTGALRQCLFRIVSTSLFGMGASFAFNLVRSR